MGSFRNRLLALIIGLVVTSQSVTLVAVLWSTSHESQIQADRQLRDGSIVVRQALRQRADQLASTVAVLAADAGFKEAVASHDPETMLSAVTEHATSIPWDLVVFMDTDGRLLKSNSAYVSAHAPSVQKLMNSVIGGHQDGHLLVVGNHLYQFFVAQVRAPDPVGWVAMGFAVDDALASLYSEQVGTQISVLAGSGAERLLVASTLPAEQRAALAALGDLGTSR